VASETDGHTAIAAAHHRFSGLQVLVNNAGVEPHKTRDETSLESRQRTLAISLTGPMIGMRLGAPLIRDSSGGLVINVSSVAALMEHYDAAYTASKWGVRADQDSGDRICRLGDPGEFDPPRPG
jgi:3alpha(or 20beta)-hydroxysteroid dehydrogenase